MLGPVLGAEAGTDDTDGFVLGITDGLILADGTKLGLGVVVRIENDMLMSSISNFGS
jgi:hypothetical protein